MNKTLHHISTVERVATYVIIFGPLLGVIYAIISAWGYGIGKLELGLLIGFYLITGLGVTIGFHRLLTHKGFETYRPIRWLLAICGSMAVEGALLTWVGRHGEHHTHSDTKNDPHSPHLHGDGVWGTIKGFWYAHVGWIFNNQPPDADMYVKHLKADKGIVLIHKLFPLWIILSFGLPALIGYLVGGDWGSALRAFLWGSLVRIFIVHHMTWSINSICHMWGTRPFKTNDESRNNVFMGIFGIGEGWHNNHHADLQSARHGFEWWQIDISWYVIWIMEKIGLAWKVKRPKCQR